MALLSYVRYITTVITVFLFCTYSNVGVANSAHAQTLTVNEDHVWTESRINVCFENRKTSYEEYYKLVEETVKETWEDILNTEFIFLTESCETLTTVRHIRIGIADERPHSLTGNALLEQESGMVLNFDFRMFAPTCQQGRVFCIKSIATLMFGKALGFDFKKNRDDVPWSCIGDLYHADEGTDIYKPMNKALEDSMRASQNKTFYCSKEWISKNRKEFLNACDQLMIAKAYNVEGSSDLAVQCQEAMAMCRNERPPGAEQFPCEQQRLWDHCDADWMEGYCRVSCDTCDDLLDAICAGDNDPPYSSPYGCEQHRIWKQCNEPWMQGYCEISCGRCKGQAKLPCDNFKEPGSHWLLSLPCFLHKLLGRCEVEWMSGSCRETCGHCRPFLGY